MTNDAPESASLGLPPANSAYWDKSAPGHDAAVAEVSAAFAATHRDDAQQGVGLTRHKSATSTGYSQAPSYSGAHRQHQGVAGAQANRSADGDTAEEWAILQDKDHPRHKEVLAERHRRFSRLNPEAPEEIDPLRDTSPEARVADARERAGTTEVDLPENLRGSWDTAAETDVLGYAARENIPANVMQEILEWYAGYVPAFGLDDAEDVFVERFGRDLAPSQVAKLRAWAKAYHGLDGDGGGA